MHGLSPQRHNMKPVASILVWAMLLPLLMAVIAVLTHGWGAFGLLVYPVQWLRIRKRALRGGCPRHLAGRYAFLILTGKFAECVGVMLFVKARLLGRTQRIIEYKTTVQPGSAS